MGEPITAGNKGPNVRGDCHVTFFPDENKKLEIKVESKVNSLYGSEILAVAEEVCQYFEVQKGEIAIEDTGALDFVLTARIEACIKKTIETDRHFLPDLIPANNYGSNRQRLRFSRLYLPGNSPKMMINAGIHRPHAVILDLEDAVSVEKKDEARLLVRNALRQVNFYGTERMVRINQLPLGLTDLEQVISSNVHVILVPKCESSGKIAQINEQIDRIKKKESLAKEVFLMPIIESARGVLNAEKIASAADNIIALAIGLEDYTADLGIKRTFEGTESFYARCHLVNVCKAFGIQAIDSVFSDVGDSQALRETVLRSKSLGFEGMGCIHPRQIRVIHEGYSPDNGEINKAKAIVIAFEKAAAEGIGVVSLGTKMIDAPVVERAQQTIASALLLELIAEDWRENHE